MKLRERWWTRGFRGVWAPHTPESTYVVLGLNIYVTPVPARLSAESSVPSTIPNQLLYCSILINSNSSRGARGPGQGTSWRNIVIFVHQGHWHLPKFRTGHHWHASGRKKTHIPHPHTQSPPPLAAESWSIFFLISAVTENKRSISSTSTRLRTGGGWIDWNFEMLHW